MSEILALWRREHSRDEAPPVDLVAFGRGRVVEPERSLQALQPPTLAGYSMELEPGYCVGDQIAHLAGLLAGWRSALASTRPTVRFTCPACDAELPDEGLCTRCCGAEAMPGRCGLSAGHEGEHEAPRLMRPGDEHR